MHPGLRTLILASFALTLTACPDETSQTGGSGGSGGTAIGGMGGEGAMGGSGAGIPLGGMGPGEGCLDCSTSEVCVDADHCASECPADRDACWINPEFIPICCEAGDVCCVSGVAGGDKCVSDAAMCLVDCPDGTTCDSGFCQQEVNGTAYSCVPTCETQKQCGDGICCPLGTRCDAGQCTLPDLSIDDERVLSSIQLAHKTFTANDCEMGEGCIDGLGDRKLLRFDLKTPNLGDGDLFLGNPMDNDLFQYSTCHDHFHFLGYARYSLIDSNGATVANGHKQAFCLLDFEQVDGGAGPAQYHCGFQGISAGWSDIYGSGLPCQWVDVTDVPPGDYSLKVEVNFDQILAESDYTNNEATVPVTIASDACPSGCANTPVSCCADGDPCGLAANGMCDCDGFYSWDAQECTDCSCSTATTCPGGCTPSTDACCDAANSCGLGEDGICQCAGTQTWDAADCAQCVSADPNCGVVDSCPNGCTLPPNACCAADDPCGWSGDGECDCAGIDWDFMDCSSCACL